TTANDTVTIGGERIETRRFTGGDTLDEPVLKTIMRDVKGVGRRVREIIWPFRRGQTFDFRSIEEGLSRGFNNEGVEGEMAGVKDWDLWGPLVFCLAISLLLSWSAPQAKDKNSQTSNSKNVMFSGVFVLIWLGLMVLTVNIKLLGGSISFFRALCVIGYGLFPLVISALLSLVLRHKLLVVKIVVNAIVVSWSVFAVRNALLHSGVWGSRSFLALFPVGLFFITLGWLCVI
ncbi:Yip1-domain-containing protein, partial [Nadsonia fulvescens var. elongata DSM 6958]